MKLNRRFLYGIFSIVLAILIAFIAIPSVTKKTNGKLEVVQVTTNIKRGMQITKDMIEVIEIGSYNIPETILKNKEEIIGSYAAYDLLPGDYISSLKISTVPLSSDLSLNEISEGMVAISVTIETLAAGLSDKLQAEDIIRFYHYDNQSNPLEPIKDIPELQYVKVLAVSDSNGLEIDYTKPVEEEEEKLQTAAITVEVTPEQAMLLARYENEGILHTTLISRGNKKRAKELLEEQAEVLKELYPEESVEKNTEIQEEQ